MRKIIILLLSLLPIFFFSCKSSQKGNTSVSKSKTIKRAGVKFVKSKTLMGLLDKAKAENKIVFVDFYTSWCLPCKMMDEDVFPDKKLAKFFNDNFISYKVDVEKGNGINLATIFDIKAYPTLMFLDDTGRVLQRKEGAIYQTELMNMAKLALENNIEYTNAR